MAKGMYPVIDGKTRKVKKNYCVVDGLTRKVKKLYAVVDGLTRLVWSAITDILGLTYSYTGLVYKDRYDSKSATTRLLWDGNNFTSPSTIAYDATTGGIAPQFAYSRNGKVFGCLKNNVTQNGVVFFTFDESTGTYQYMNSNNFNLKDYIYKSTDDYKLYTPHFSSDGMYMYLPFMCESAANMDTSLAVSVNVDRYTNGDDNLYLARFKYEANNPHWKLIQINRLAVGDDLIYHSFTLDPQHKYCAYSYEDDDGEDRCYLCYFTDKDSSEASSWRRSIKSWTDAYQVYFSEDGKYVNVEGELFYLGDEGSATSIGTVAKCSVLFKDRNKENVYHLSDNDYVYSYLITETSITSLGSYSAAAYTGRVSDYSASQLCITSGQSSSSSNKGIVLQKITQNNNGVITGMSALQTLYSKGTMNADDLLKINMFINPYDC